MKNIVFVPFTLPSLRPWQSHPNSLAVDLSHASLCLGSWSSMQYFSYSHVSLSCTSCTCPCHSVLHKSIWCRHGILACWFIFSWISSLTFALSGGSSFGLVGLLMSGIGFCVVIASLGCGTWMLVSTLGAGTIAVVPSTLEVGAVTVIPSTLGFDTAVVVLSIIGFGIVVVAGEFWFRSSSNFRSSFNFRNASISFIPSVLLCCFNVAARSSIAFVSMSAGVTVGWVMYRCLKNTVSKICSLFIFLTWTLGQW